MSRSFKCGSCLLFSTCRRLVCRCISRQEVHFPVERVVWHWVSGESRRAVVGVDWHAGVFDQQVLQRAGLQENRLTAMAGEAGGRSHEPALLQRTGVQMQEPAFLLLLLIPIFIVLCAAVGRGVERGAGGEADSGAGHRRRDNHQVFVLLLFLFMRDDGGVREAVTTSFSCRGDVIISHISSVKSEERKSFMLMFFFYF